MHHPALADFLRATIRERGPVSFRWFMEQALYHPQYGFYSAGRCAIGRRGDYFTNVSVGSLFGRLMALQFSEMWDLLERPQEFILVEQGAHHGDFARDVFLAARADRPQFFEALHYRIVEPFPILQQRQQEILVPFDEKIQWRKSTDELEPFVGAHFSNELIDAMPVHLIAAKENAWTEKFVAIDGSNFAFTEKPICNADLREHLAKLPPPPGERYESEINLSGLAWIESLSTKLERGWVLAVDYGHSREDFYAPERTEGTLCSFAQHRSVASSLENVGETDMTAHVDWTSLAERAESRGLSVAGFTDQHHYLTALATTFLPNELSHADAEPSRRALQTLLHPGLLGRTFQFLAFEKNLQSPTQLAGFKFARDPRTALGLSRR